MNSFVSNWKIEKIYALGKYNNEKQPGMFKLGSKYSLSPKPAVLLAKTQRLFLAFC